MNETMKVFVACAIGAFIGTIVTLEVNHYFWWLGLLAGGFVGYISYEFKKVVMAIPTAWRKASGWQPDQEWWREYCRCIFGSIGFTYTIMIPVLGPLLWFYPEVDLPERINSTILYFGTTSLIGIFFGALLPLGFATEEMSEQVPYLNPFRIYFWLLPKWTLKGGWWFLKESPFFLTATFWDIVAVTIVATEFTVRFGKALFREIHSDLRILCGLDAAIGTVIGYFAGNAIIGAVAGGLWGALNFEILSIRVLKLVPIEKSLFR